MDSSVATPSAPGDSHTPEPNANLDRQVAAEGKGGGEPPGETPSPNRFAPPPRRHYGWRTILGCLIVLLASGGAAAVVVLEQVHTIVQDISVNKPLKVSSTSLAQSQFGQPETLLMVGDDTRKGFRYYNAYVPDLANEMLLVRIDPSKPWISMMSLPRELWVNVTEPNGLTYTNRLNSAYTYGTTTLLRTIRHVTGLSVNHVVVTTFPQFERAINKLGCVYDTIDERYFHNNAFGGDQYQNVDLQPGYQCLNGSEAEQFVSYRHTDTSQIRDARDQSFLLAVKQQYGPQLAGNIGEFEKVFGETVRTDPGLRSSTEILSLANLLISAQSLRVRQVHFQTSACITTCPSGDLTATPQQIHDSVHNFLFGGDVTPTRQVRAISHRLGRRGALASLPLTPTLATNVAAERADARRLPFTAEFPRVQDLAGSAFPVAQQCTQQMQPCIRNYVIHAPDGNAYPIYVQVFSNGNLGQFYDVQGTTWTGAPMLAHPNQSIRIGSRTYELYYEGSHLATVAWRQYGAIYWVHNTLTDTVGNGELMAIADQTRPVGTVRGTPTHVILKAFSVPSRQPSTTAAPVIESIGRVGALVTLALLPLGLFVVFRNWRRLRALRGRLNTAWLTAAALEAQLAVVADGYAPTTSPRHAESVIDPPAAARSDGGPSVPGKHDPTRTRWASVALAAGLALAAVIVYLAFGSSLFGDRHALATHRPPTASVAVLNAGWIPHAAHRLALDLARRHVHVVAIGNLEGAAPASYEVLYARGDGKQAQLLAAILSRRHPRVAQIGAATAQAIGSAPRLVVVIP